MGFFSWTTCDSNESIMNSYTDECRPVYLLQPNKQPSILEPSYEGYGIFGGIDAFVWLAVNNLPDNKREGLTDSTLRNIGISLANGDFFVDTETKKSWGCSLHIESLQTGLPTFKRFDEPIIGEKSPNDLIVSGRWVRHPMTELIGVISHPLKFSFDKAAIYESLPASKDCPRQGYFYLDDG